MSGNLDETTTQFQLNTEWTSSIEEGIKDILLNTWQEWGFEEIDEEFIIFVLDMIKTRKTMSNISDELIAVGLDATQAKFITEKFVEFLKSIPVSAPKSSEDKSLDRLLAPLKTPRNPNEEKAEKTTNDKRHVSRLLNSALSSARNDSKAKDPKKGKRNVDDMLEGNINNNNGNGARKNKFTNNQQEDSSGKNPHKQQKTENPAQAFQAPLPPFPPGPMPMGFPPMPPNYGMLPNDPIQYFEHMNEVALKSGFKNAQEMLSAFQGNPVPPQYPPYGGGNYPYAPPPYEQPPFHPPYPGPRHHGGRNQAARTHYRAGRGRGGGDGTEPITTTTTTGKVENTSAPEKEGANNTVAPPKTHPLQGTDETTAQSPSVNQVDVPVHEGAPRGPATGRFSGRGGGRFARGAPTSARGGGRFGGGRAPTVPTVPTFNNPFASNNQSLEAAVSNAAAVFNPAPAGRGRGRAATAGRASGSGNKVWVRPTEATPQNIQS